MNSRKLPAHQSVLFTPFVLTAVSVTGLWTAIYLATGASVPAMITLCGLAGFSLCLPGKRSDTSLIGVRNHAAVGITFGIIFALYMVTGGTDGIAVPWLPLLALFSAFLLTPKLTLVWCLLLIVLTGIILSIEARIQPLQTLPRDSPLPLDVLSVITAVSTAAVLTYFFSRAHHAAHISVSAANRNFVRMLDTVPEPLAVFAPHEGGQFVCTYANHPLTTRVGAKVQGLFVDELPVGGVERFQRHLADVVRSGERSEATGSAGICGERRLVQVISQPLIESGSPVQVVSIFRDLTAQEEEQTRRLHAARLASIGELAAGVAHEIRNPLMVIRGTLEIADIDGDPDALREDLASISDSAERATQIVTGLVQFARQSSGTFAAVDLNEVVESMLKLRTQLLIRNDIEVRVELSDEPVVVQGDRIQLGQVVVNLLSNAEHATLKGPTTDRLITIRTDASGDKGVLEVEDNGIGLSPDIVGRIFDPFFTTKAVGEGTGLGLSILDGIVETHGGSIQVQSSPGSGSTFTVTLPLSGEIAPTDPGGRQCLPVASGRLGRVMVVDDEAPVRRVVQRYLTKKGFDVHAAVTGADALRMAGSRTWDAVILDWRMPDLDGKAVCERLERDHPALARRVIIATGDAASVPPSYPILVKPYALDDLEALLNETLGQPNPSD
jgi:signal transduction histidine kinase